MNPCLHFIEQVSVLCIYLIFGIWVEYAVLNVKYLWYIVVDVYVKCSVYMCMENSNWKYFYVNHNNLKFLHHFYDAMCLWNFGERLLLHLCLHYYCWIRIITSSPRDESEKNSKCCQTPGTFAPSVYLTHGRLADFYSFAILRLLCHFLPYEVHFFTFGLC